jgi:pimeloyl-ACP methyl ester carboxylesterase
VGNGATSDGTRSRLRAWFRCRAALGLVTAGAALGVFAGIASAHPVGASVAAPGKLGPVKHISANGISIGYRVGGHGPWLIMVIGRGATMAEWDPQLIAQLIRNHRVLVFDNRGIGTTDNTSTQTLSIQQMARDTLALARALHVDRFDLMGWSMGGYISQQVTLDAPSRVRRLVLCATDSGGSHYVLPIPPVEKILTNPNGVTTAQLFALSFPPDKAGLAGAINYMYRVATQPDLISDSFTITSSAQQQQEKAAAAWKSSSGGVYDELPQIKQPTLVMWGNLDLPVRPKNDRILVQRIPRAQGKVFKGAGHAFLFQDATQVGQTADSFLRAPDEGLG